jgi:predicted Rossmann fold flavoprotein
MPTASQPVDVAIVGAGAAGLAAAIFAAGRLPGRRVSAFDGAPRLGAKILVSGGARCNVTNVHVSERDFWGGERSFIRRVLRAFPAAEARAFFEGIGVGLHEEPGGKLFPDTNRARTVLDALLREARRSGIELCPGARVLGVARREPGFELATSVGPIPATHVVLATGGLSLPKTGSDGLGYRLAASLGHSLVPTTPALAPLVLRGGFHAALSGVSCEAEVLFRAEGRPSLRLTGPMLFTHFGVSGPVVLDLSRHWHRAALECRKTAVSVGFLGRGGFPEAEKALLALADARPRASLESALSTLVPASLAAALLRERNVEPGQPLSDLRRESRSAIAHALADWPLPVEAGRGYGFAEATAGGIPLGEVDAATMESRVCPGLYLVGEMLDVDGRLGGFNFQWAWSSGFVAARGLEAALEHRAPGS